MPISALPVFFFMRHKKSKPGIQRNEVAAGVSKGGAFGARERGISAPLVAFFGTFLCNHKKVQEYLHMVRSINNP